jgi:hypothetical protein
MLFWVLPPRTDLNTVDVAAVEPATTPTQS